MELLDGEDPSPDLIVLSGVVAEAPGEAASPATCEPGCLDAINRALGDVRQCMVLRFWENSANRWFNVVTHSENVSRVVTSLSGSGLFPPGFVQTVVNATAVADVEASRVQIIAFLKNQLLDYVEPLMVDFPDVKRSLMVNNIHDAACLCFEFSLLLRLEHVMALNVTSSDGGRIRRLVRPNYIGTQGEASQLPDEYKRRDPQAVLKEALAGRRDLAKRIAWARRRIIINRQAKGEEAVQPAVVVPEGETHRVRRTWAGFLASVMRTGKQEDLLD